MDAYSILVAWQLITSPMGVYDSPELVEEFRLAVVQLALTEQLMDKRETNYILNRNPIHGEQILNDLDIIKARYNNLKNAPKIEDCYLFPDRSVLNEWLSFNCAYQRHCEDKIKCDEFTKLFYLKAKQETEQLYKIYDLVRDAQCEYYYITVRRQALKNLKEILGNDNYYNGNLPPYVPIWRFTDDSQ